MMKKSKNIYYKREVKFGVIDYSNILKALLNDIVRAGLLPKRVEPRI